MKSPPRNEECAYIQRHELDLVVISNDGGLAGIYVLVNLYMGARADFHKERFGRAPLNET
jgi:hypothetical protein